MRTWVRWVLGFKRKRTGHHGLVGNAAKRADDVEKRGEEGEPIRWGKGLNCVLLNQACPSQAMFLNFSYVLYVSYLLY
jgi:hypothetical protein